jgi:hypothetical protein
MFTLCYLFRFYHWLFKGRKLLGEIAVEILQYIDVYDLNAAERVSVLREAFISGQLWEQLFKRIVSSNRAHYSQFFYHLYSHLHLFYSVNQLCVISY